MDKKLTLSLNDAVIEKAKLYAKQNSTSLSKLIESYLASLVGSRLQEIEVSPLVQSLTGVITLPDDFDEREDRARYLSSKYK